MPRRVPTTRSRSRKCTGRKYNLKNYRKRRKLGEDSFLYRTRPTKKEARTGSWYNVVSYIEQQETPPRSYARAVLVWNNLHDEENVFSWCDATFEMHKAFFKLPDEQNKKHVCMSMLPSAMARLNDTYCICAPPFFLPIFSPSASIHNFSHFPSYRMSYRCLKLWSLRLEKLQLICDGFFHNQIQFYELITVEGCKSRRVRRMVLSSQIPNDSVEMWYTKGTPISFFVTSTLQYF